MVSYALRDMETMSNRNAHVHPPKGTSQTFTTALRVMDANWNQVRDVPQQQQE